MWVMNILCILSCDCNEADGGNELGEESCKDWVDDSSADIVQGVVLEHTDSDASDCNEDAQ